MWGWMKTFSFTQSLKILTSQAPFPQEAPRDANLYNTVGVAVIPLLLPLSLQILHLQSIGENFKREKMDLFTQLPYPEVLCSFFDSLFLRQWTLSWNKVWCKRQISKTHQSNTALVALWFLSIDSLLRKSPPLINDKGMGKLEQCHFVPIN